MAGSSQAPATGDSSSDASPIYCSPTFKFIVEGKDFHVHESLITKYSKPLDIMIHGPMAEAEKGFATLEEVNQGTFLRFVEFLYKGYYHAAEHEQLEQPSEGIVQEESEEDMAVEQTYDAYGNRVWVDPDQSRWRFGEERSFDSKCFNKAAARARFINRQYTMRNISLDHPQPRPKNASAEDYSEVFLCHAHLYVFADKYDIQGLKVLAMEELHAMLTVYTMRKERTGEIMSLLKYIYAETAETRAGVEDLRTLMVQYIEIEVGTLIEDEGLGELMIEDGGCMLADFLKVMKKRLAYPMP